MTGIHKKPVRLAISGHHHRALRSHLFPGDGKEAVAFALCGRARRADLELLLVRDIVPVPHELCRVRTEHTVVWPGIALDVILTRAEHDGLAVVKVHSHPTGYPWFSHTDDAADADMFPGIFAWLDSDAPLASMIMLPGGRLFGRVVREDGVGEPLECVRVADHDFKFWWNAEHEAEVPAHGMRVAQAFGDQTYTLLSRLRVGVVGGSGTGSLMVEQNARNGTGEIVVVDADRVEHKNLNRIVNATWIDAKNKTHKTTVLKRAIDAMGMGTRVVAIADDLLNREVLKVLSTCDVLFGCMDTVDGRHVLNKLASAYIIPLFDLGVRIDADGRGGIDAITYAVHTVLPGGSSLFSRRVYSQEDLDAAFLRRTDVSAYEKQVKQGYIKGQAVDRPAVISVNMAAASAAMNEFLSRIHPFRVESNEKFASRRISLTDPDASINWPDGAPCPVMGRLVGTGDQEPFLGMPLLGHPKEQSP